MDIYEDIVELRKQGRKAALATIVNVRGSVPSFKTAKMLVRDDGSIGGTIGGGCVEAEVWQAAREVMQSEKPRTLKFDLNQDPKYDTGLVCGGTLEIFVEPILPPATLYLFGAGHVSQQLGRTAQAAGFEITVVDDRDAYANRERFPEATEIIADDFESAFRRIAPRESSYIVIVTRGHHDDMRVLRWAVQTPARYIGMIGSRRKTIAIFRELTAEGIAPQLFDRVHAPVGLDIGAITPEEIAIAITAELIAIRRKAERALPHMSWFNNSPVESDPPDSGQEAIQEVATKLD
ncbi:MAG: XdhC family protein [Acidobacteriales bacterium]|nr:XdhC family protein [Terriglobales bacterium]